jgi:hypothetical protein
VQKSKIGRSRASLLTLACSLAALALLATATPAWSAASEEPPLPSPSNLYPYYMIPSVSVEVTGSYTEHYTTPQTGDVEEVELLFKIARSYSKVEWSSSTSPPSAGSELGFSMQPTLDTLDAVGAYRDVHGPGPLAGQSFECIYSPKSPEPEFPSSAGFYAGVIEMTPYAQTPGTMSVKFQYPLSGSLITVIPGAEGELCESVKAVGTSGTSLQGVEYLLALSPIDSYSINNESGMAEQTFKFPHSYSGTFEGDQVDLSDEVVVKANLLFSDIPPPPFGHEGPPEQHGPSTPVPQPTKPEEPPHVPEPEVEADPPVVTGGGGSPTKLHTGITAKCPKAGNPCTVTGIVEAELPAPRPARKASTSHAGKVRRVVLGRVSFPLAPGASKPVSIALSKAGVAFLRSHPGAHAKIAVTVASGAATASRTRTAKLRLPRPHRRR